jgi:hypothetical protein
VLSRLGLNAHNDVDEDDGRRQWKFEHRNSRFNSWSFGRFSRWTQLPYGRWWNGNGNEPNVVDEHGWRSYERDDDVQYASRNDENHVLEQSFCINTTGLYHSPYRIWTIPSHLTVR